MFGITGQSRCKVGTIDAISPYRQLSTDRQAAGLNPVAVTNMVVSAL